MAFHFSLETLLRYRRSIERQRELRLFRAAQEVQAIAQEIGTVNGAIAAIHESQAHAATGAQLQFDLIRGSVLRGRRRGLEADLLRKQAAKVRCEKEFQSAHRDREAVEVLREEQLQDYRPEEDRREQRRLDDIFLLRREYLLRR
jgi:flagellar export protein FliJ